MLLTAERGSAWTLLHPRYSVAIADVISIPITYPMAQGDANFVNFVNSWIEIKTRDRAIQTLYDHWILGRTAESTKPRWSILRDVLHWVE